MKQHHNCTKESCDLCQTKPKGLTWQKPLFWVVSIVFVLWITVTLVSISLVWENGNSIIAERQGKFAEQAEAQGFPEIPEYYNIDPLPWYVRYYIYLRKSHVKFYEPQPVHAYKKHVPIDPPYGKLGNKKR